MPLDIWSGLELLESVRANLRMMIYLVHPDGEIVMDYSGRQDFGQKFTLANYYSIYQLMAVHDRDPLFAAMASLAEVITHPGALPNNAMLKPFATFGFAGELVATGGSSY